MPDTLTYYFVARISDAYGEPTVVSPPIVSLDDARKNRDILRKATGSHYVIYAPITPLAEAAMASTDTRVAFDPEGRREQGAA
jgi:hypothetical protein